MKTQEEIEQLANEWSLINSDGTMETNSSLNKGYINGYTQCQKDMADKKYTEEDIICPKCKGINQYFIVENNYKCAYTDCEHIFNKQD